MSDNALTVPPRRQELCQFSKAFGQRFIVTVDTEEEFDWNKPLARTGYGLNSVEKLSRFQQFCEGNNVCPIYLVDYPVITYEPAAECLRDFVQRNAATVGAQLHPWVNPPFEEDTNRYNSFAGNLPYKTERAKLLTLTEQVTKAIGTAPLIYRAGRYGAGPNTTAILKEAGYAIDSSVRSKFDYGYLDGPDYSRHPNQPYWLDRESGLIEAPLTTVFWGLLRRQGDTLYPYLSSQAMLCGLLARTNLLERIALTPEGITVEEAIRAIDIAKDDGLPLLTFSFHSPSLQAGHTPYVRERSDVDSLYDWWRRVFAYCDICKIRPASIEELVSEIRSQNNAGPSTGG